jgi:hypothetical protein
MKQYIVDERGRRTGVVLSLKEYERLLEDLNDLRLVAERVDEPTKSLEEVKASLTSGRLQALQPGSDRHGVPLDAAGR